MLRLMIGLLMLASFAALPVQAASAFDGVWQGPFGIMTFEHLGNQVIGTYTCCGDGVILGMVTGQRLSFRWHDLVNGSGDGAIELSDDGQTITGTLASTKAAPGSGTWSGTRLPERPPEPRGRKTHWQLSFAEQTPPPETGATTPMAVQGSADLFFDGNKVEGYLAGRLRAADQPPDSGIVEVFNWAAGTRSGDHMSLICTNPYDGSKESTEFVYQPDSGQWIGTAASGITRLTPAGAGHTETLIEQAWVRHKRLWLAFKTAQGADWASPFKGSLLLSANALLLAGKPDKALDAFVVLTQVYQALGDVRHQAYALSGQSTALQQLARFEEARQRLKAILDMEGLDQSVKHDAERSIDVLHTTIGVSNRKSDKRSELTLPPIPEDDPIRLKEQAWEARKSKDFAAAQGFYDQAIAAYQSKRRETTNPVSLRGTDISIASVWQQEAMVELSRGDTAAAANKLEQAVAVWRHTEGAQPALSSALSWLSALYQRLGRMDSAISAVEEAMATADAAQVKDHWGVIGQRARLAVAMHDDQAAGHYFQQVVALVEGLRAGLITDETKAAYFGPPSAVYEEYVAFLMERLNDPRTALKVAEQSRSRALLDTLDRTGPELGPGYAFAGETSSLSVLPVIDADQALALAQQDRSAFLVYFTTARASYVWLITPDGHLHSGRIDRSATDIRRLIDEYRNQIAFSDDRDAQRQALTRLLSEPVAAALAGLPEGTRVTVVPHKYISQIPFGALGETLGAWGDKWQLTVLPSLSVAMQLPHTVIPRQGPLLAAGAPAGVRGLPLSADEVNAAAAVFPGATILLEDDATAPRVLAELPRHRIALLSTHTREIDRNAVQPELKLLLANGNSLSQADLKRGSLAGMSLVILSACESATGPRMAGDELMNLARAFLIAGAERVLITLWPVQDQAAARIIPAFLTRIKDGTEAAAALASAIRDYRGQLMVDQTHPSPITWAPWILVARHG